MKKSNQIKIIIDPRCSYSYSSFYLYGLIQLFGHKSVSYSLKPFKNLKDPRLNLQFVVIKNNVTRRIFIHTRDVYQLDIDGYNWCDVYGHVNANFKYYPHDKYPKIRSLVPSYGIRVFSLFEMLGIAVCNFFKSLNSIIYRDEWNAKKDDCVINPIINIKLFFHRFYKGYESRLPYEVYANNERSEDNYVFFLSTLWFSDEYVENDKAVNRRRAHFIRACKMIQNITFEGGLYAKINSIRDEFVDVAVTERISISEWVKKTKKSTFVFNTPAFSNCHGWKLGEYLAMGKCIISTKLSNDLPAPLEHGKHIHYVEDNVQSIKDAIEYIQANPEYRRRLEMGASDYWNKYGNPIESLNLLGINR